MRGASSCSDSGFTLLEAIVALVIFSTAGLALFSWINQNLQALSRVAEVGAESQAKRNILEFMNEVNPMEQSVGANDFGTYRIQWKSVEEIPPRPNAGYPVGIGTFVVGLYRNGIDVTRPNGAPWFTFEVRMVGYRRTVLAAPSNAPGS